MPSVDLVSEINLMEMENAVNTVLREVETRYDFKDSKTEINLDKKEKLIHVVAADDMKIKAVKEMLLVACTKRGIETSTLDFQKEEPAAGGMLKFDIKLKEGLSKDDLKTINNAIKDGKFKVTTANMGDKLRVTGKKIDELQAIMQLAKTLELSVPVQATNMKS